MVKVHGTRFADLNGDVRHALVMLSEVKHLLKIRESENPVKVYAVLTRRFWRHAVPFPAHAEIPRESRFPVRHGAPDNRVKIPLLELLGPLL